MSEEVNGQIRYTAKELFEKIDGKLDHIDEKLDEKVGRAEFENFKKRIETNRENISSLDAKLVRYIAIGNTLIAIGVLAVNHYLP